MNPILREIARLRQRVSRVEISRSLLDTATVGVLLAGAALATSQLLRRPLVIGASIGASLLLLGLVVGIVRGLRNGRRSDIFLAKWLDLENKLEDRFASSYEFQTTNDPNKFCQACVQTTLTYLAQRSAPLQLPALPVGGAWWRPMAATGLVLAGILVAQLARPASAVSLDARRRLKVPRAATQALQQAATRVTQSDNKQLKSVGTEVNRLIDKLNNDSVSKEEALSTLTEAQLAAKQVDQALAGNDIQVPELAKLPPGPVLDLVNSLNRKDLESAISALQRAAANAGAGALSSTESAALAQVLRQLQGSVGRATPALTGSIDRAVQALNSGKPGDTQTALTEVGKDLPKTKGTFDTSRAIRELITKIDDLRVQARNDGQPTPPPPSATAAATPGAPRPAAAPSPPGQIPKDPVQPGGESDDLPAGALAEAVKSGVSGGIGDAAGADVRTNQTTSAAKGPLQHVAGNYQGKTLKQLISTSEGGNASDKAELRKLVATYGEVVQQRLAREEIPAAYAAPVRRYFEQVRLQAER